MKINFTQKILSLRKSFQLFNEQKRVSRINNTVRNKKILVIKITNPFIYHRYFYTFLKFFTLSGYSIYFPLYNFLYFRKNIYTRQTQEWILFNQIFLEGLLILEEAPKTGDIIELNDADLSPDYFSPFLLKENTQNYHVPMPMHPNMYFKNLYSELPGIKKRKLSVFMVGNVDRNYQNFEEDLFKMESRREVYDYLNSKISLHSMNSMIELKHFVESERDYEYVIIDSSKFRIKMEDLRPVLQQFSFYLNLPGVVMPHSHNVTEALSVGAIPIIHKEYAKLMKPMLRHMENSIIFTDLEDLLKKMNLAISLSKSKIAEIRENAFFYYNEYLTPKSVVQKIVNREMKMIYLQAEHRSVEIVRDKVKSQQILA